MDDALLVRGSDGVRDLSRHRDGLGRRQCAGIAQERIERLTVDELEHEIRRSLQRLETVNAGDVGMLQ